LQDMAHDWLRELSFALKALRAFGGRGRVVWGIADGDDGQFN